MQSALSNLPVGWRFQPTNLELLDHYLKKKRLGHPIDGSDIQDIQIYDFDPWELVDENCRDKERYVFCRRQFQRTTGGNQRKRKAKGGFWKRTGEIQSITLEDSDEVIGTKTIFVYHDPKSTDYVKHEFEYTAELVPPVQDAYDFVLCKLMINTKKKANKKASKSSSSSKNKEGNKAQNMEVDYEQSKPKVDCKKTKPKVDCRKTKPNKKESKGLPFRHTELVSVSDNQKQEKIMAHNSTYGEGESSIHMTSDFEYHTPSNIMIDSASGEGETIDLMTSDNDSQLGYSSNYNKADANFLVASDLHNQIPKERTIVSSYSIAGTSELVAADLENKTPNELAKMSSYDPGCPSMAGTSGLLSADLVDENPNLMANMSSCNPGCQRSSWVENQNQYERTVVSTNKKVEASYLTDSDFETRFQNEMISEKYNLFVTSDFDNQNSTEIINISASLRGDVADDLENQIPHEMAYMSSNEMHNPGRSSWVENQNPNERTIILTNEKGDSSCLRDFDFEDRNNNVMIYLKGKPSNLFVTLDFVSQNPSENPDISTSLEGKCNPPKEAHSDFGKQNRCDLTDMSNSGCGQSALLASGFPDAAFKEVESQYEVTHIPNLDDLEMASFPEIYSEMLDELTALDDLKDTLCSEPTQPIHTKESPIYCGLGASMSA